MKRYLSLGAGVQSTTVALLAAVGEIPPIDAAIFADTQAEPAAVYRQLEWLKAHVSFPIHVVTEGSLRQEIMDATHGAAKYLRVPLFVRNPDNSSGMINRQCTDIYKVIPIQRKLRELLGVKPRSRGPATPIVEQLFGISLDEAHRMRDAQFRWSRYTYPLIDLRMTRRDCLQWLERRGYPRPPKSACTFCPYHSDAHWLAMKTHDADAWDEAVVVDDALRAGAAAGVTGQPYLHRSLMPLRDVTFTHEKQADLFGNECAGVCGV